MAHAIQYAQSLSDPMVGELIRLSGYRQESRSGTEFWVWRNYSFTIQTLAGLGRFEEAVELGKNFLNTYETDSDTSKVVTQIGTIMHERGRRQEAGGKGLSPELAP